jgi:hypothetical protein
VNDWTLIVVETSRWRGRQGRGDQTHDGVVNDGYEQAAGRVVLGELIAASSDRRGLRTMTDSDSPSGEDASRLVIIPCCHDDRRAYYPQGQIGPPSGLAERDKNS